MRLKYKPSSEPLYTTPPGDQKPSVFRPRYRMSTRVGSGHHIAFSVCAACSQAAACPPRHATPNVTIPHVQCAQRVGTVILVIVTPSPGHLNVAAAHHTAYSVKRRAQTEPSSSPITPAQKQWINTCREIQTHARLTASATAAFQKQFFTRRSVFPKPFTRQSEAHTGPSSSPITPPPGSGVGNWG